MLLINVVNTVAMEMTNQITVRGHSGLQIFGYVLLMSNMVVAMEMTNQVIAGNVLVLKSVGYLFHFYNKPIPFGSVSLSGDLIMTS